VNYTVILNYVSLANIVVCFIDRLLTDTLIVVCSWVKGNEYASLVFTDQTVTT